MALAKGKLCTRNVDVWELIPCGSILCVCGFVCKSVWEPLVCRVLDHLQLGLQLVVSHQVGAETLTSVL